MKTYEFKPQTTATHPVMRNSLIVISFDESTGENHNFLTKLSISLLTQMFNCVCNTFSNESIDENQSFFFFWVFKKISLSRAVLFQNSCLSQSSLASFPLRGWIVSTDRSTGEDQNALSLCIFCSGDIDGCLKNFVLMPILEGIAIFVIFTSYAFFGSIT